MQTGLGKDVIELIVVIEFSLIILMIFATYFAKLSAILLARRRQRIIAAVEAYLTKAVDSNIALDLKGFKRRWKKIQLIFPILAKFDAMYSTKASWLSVKKSFIQDILLPLARKRARSRRWLLRFYSSETFALIYEPQDELLLLRLLRDRIPLVHLNSINTAIKARSEAGINAVITRMSKMSWLTQSMYLMPFANAPHEIREFVEKRLKASKEENIRAECYKILGELSPATVDWDMQPDLNSPDFELRLAALKFMLHHNQEEALPILVDKLHDPHWEIRLVALHRLGKLKCESAINAIAACLTDAEWRVKMAAAIALKMIGGKGESVLKKLAPELSKIPFDGGQ